MTDLLYCLAALFFVLYILFCCTFFATGECTKPHKASWHVHFSFYSLCWQANKQTKPELTTGMEDKNSPKPVQKE